MTATAISTPAVAERERSHGLAEFWRESLVFAGRNVQHIRQLPEKLLDVTVQPIMFTLLFAYVFGGAIDVPGVGYREYLIGGILIQTITFGMMGPATSIATDLQEGVIDRFRSLPSRRSAYLSGHFLAELAGLGLAITILLASGLSVGWRTHNAVGPVLVAFVLLVLFASAMVVVGTLIGIVVRTPDAVMGVGFTIVFPITFLSNAFVPSNTLPTVLQHIAEWNPISTLVFAVRDLFGNNPSGLGAQPWPLEHALPLAFAWCALLMAITVPLVLRRYNARTTD